MMRAKLYKPSRSATQSGMANTHHWVLEYLPSEARRIDPLMGWTSSGDMNSQVRLRFESKEAAMEYAKDKGLELELTQPRSRKPNIRPRGYGENFAPSRRSPWTH